MDIILSKDAARHFLRLPKIEQAKIQKKLALLRVNPYSGKKLGGELKGNRSLRAWPYRVIYEINEKTQQIQISSILHRQGAYK